MPDAIPFCHLHVLSEFSFPDGACRVADLVRRAAGFDPPAVAVTDQGTLHAAVAFYEAARRGGVKPLIGCRIDVAVGTGTPADGPLVLLAESLAGYRNLLRLSTDAQLGARDGRPLPLSAETLAAHRAGLIALSGGPGGPIDGALRAGRPDEAARRAGALAELFGCDRFFLELQDQGRPGQAENLAALRALAADAGLPAVVTNGVRYLRPEDAPAQRLLRRIRAGGTGATDPRLVDTPGRHDLADAAEMARRFPGDADALRRTAEIAFRCTAELVLHRDLHFSRFPLPPGHARDGESRAQAEFRLLREQVDAGLARRFGGPAGASDDRVRERIERELEVIRATGFVNYFLVVADYVGFARAQGIAVGPGRGSGAGSLAAYALGITEIDPLRYGLSFERFLNPERPSPPDFDVDFCPDRRGEVIAYLRDKYGGDRVAQVIAFNTFASRAALRDAARVLDVPADAADRWARMIPEDSRSALSDAVRANPDLRRTEAAEPAAARVFRVAGALEGLPRNSGTHAAGLVLSDRPLVELTPLQRDREGAVITQYDMSALSAVGLVKVDILGLRTLGALREAAEWAGAATGAPVNLEQVPLDDPEVMALLNRADTVGIFQLESPGMRDVLRRMGIAQFGDLAAAIALHRPATMPILDEFIARKHGRSSVTYDHPALRPVLEETFGLVLYQEQVQQAAQALAGFSPAEGDRLRRAIADADEGELRGLAAAFAAGCRRRRRMKADAAEALFDRLRRNAGYGFNKAHSVAYALLAWRAAWLKARHPAAFLCGQLSVEAGTAERRAALLDEAQRLGVELLGPDLNLSGERFSLDAGRLRCGLAAVKFVGPDAARAIVAERAAGGSFRGLHDLCARVPATRLPRRALESLVRAGALDFTGIARRRLFDGLDAALSAGGRPRDAAQPLLPGMDAVAADGIDDGRLPATEPWPESVRMAAERELLGFHTSGHPMTRYEWMLRLLELDGLSRGAVTAGTAVRCAGLVTRLRRGTATEFRIEMADRAVEATLRPPADGDWLREGAAVWVEGIPSATPDGVRLEAARLEPIATAPDRLARRVLLHLPPALEDATELAVLREALARHAGPVPVELCLRLPAGERVRLDTGPEFAVTVSQSLVRAVERILGKDALYVDVTPAGAGLGTSARPDRRAPPRR